MNYCIAEQINTNICTHPTQHTHTHSYLHIFLSQVIEPYKKVLSHGGYLLGSSEAIIVFSACFLPDRSRKDYDYVMDNLFM